MALFGHACLPACLLKLTPEFSCVLQGVANRGASVRVGRDTEKDGKGKMAFHSYSLSFVLIDDDEQRFSSVT